MIKGFILVCSFSIIQLCTAQSQLLKTSESDPKAKKMLDVIKKDYDTYKSFEVSFDLEVELPSQPKQIQKGKLIQQGKKYFVSMTDQDIYCDGSTIWFYQKDSKEVQINNSADGLAADFVSPKDMLRIYENGKYAYAITGEISENGTQLTQIEFKPLEKKSPYTKLRLTVNKKTGKAVSLKIFSRDGTKMTLFIKNIWPNKAYSTDTFVFNTKKFPGVKVEDLRID